MKVGVYVPGYEPSAGGGYTFEYDVVTSLLALMSETAHEFVFFSSASSAGSKNALAEKMSVQVISTRNATPLGVRMLRKAINGFANQIRYPGDLSYAAEKAGVDIMWFVTPSYEMVNIPFIATIWDLQHRLQPWFPEVGSVRDWYFREGYFSEFVRRASFVIAGTQAGTDEIAMFYQIPRDRIRILRHPTPSFIMKTDKAEDQRTLEKYRLSPGYLFYPAQFWPHKNHVNLLHALKILEEEFHLSRELVLVGSDKGNLEHIKQHAKMLKIEDRVRVLGFVSQEELISLYRNAIALTYASFFGPENLPPLEAFAIGCPVIAAGVNGSEEQLGDAALLVDPGKPREIAAAVKRLIDDPAMRADLISRGRSRILDRTGADFVRGVFKILDDFEEIRRNWN